MIQRQRADDVGGAAQGDGLGAGQGLRVEPLYVRAPLGALCVNRSDPRQVLLGQPRGVLEVATADGVVDNARAVAPDVVAEYPGAGVQPGVLGRHSGALQCDLRLLDVIRNEVIAVGGRGSQPDRLVQELHAVREGVPEQGGRLDDHVDPGPAKFLDRHQIQVGDDPVVVPDRAHADQVQDLRQVRAVVPDQLGVPEREADLLGVAPEPFPLGIEERIRQRHPDLPRGPRGHLLGVDAVQVAGSRKRRGVPDRIAARAGRDVAALQGVQRLGDLARGEPQRRENSPDSVLVRTQRRSDPPTFQGCLDMTDSSLLGSLPARATLHLQPHLVRGHASDVVAADHRCHQLSRLAGRIVLGMNMQSERNPVLVDQVDVELQLGNFLVRRQPLGPVEAQILVQRAGLA